MKKIMNILRKCTVFLLAFSLCVTTVACGGEAQTNSNSPASNISQNQTVNNTRIADGRYEVQQASYDDADGSYTLFLIGSNPPRFQTDNLQMARLTDEEIKAGQKTYLKVENGQPVLYLTEDFKIEYIHNVTENRTNPQTGQTETVIVRRENGFWAPFAGAVAGQAIGSLLFRPQYYVPPVYSSGGIIYGYGGYGRTYNDAVASYRNQYNSAPAAVRNRTNFRTTGTIRRNYPNTSTVRNTPPRNTGSRATGSGYGSSTLRSSGRSTPRRSSGSSSSFGSSRGSSTRRSTGFGSRRR